jgi:hypothetical protein
VHPRRSAAESTEAVVNGSGAGTRRRTLRGDRDRGGFSRVGLKDRGLSFSRVMLKDRVLGFSRVRLKDRVLCFSRVMLKDGV